MSRSGSPAGSGSSSPRLADLRADCARCFGLCCVVPAFSVSAGFAIDKPAGQPCPNLRADFRCGIHTRLRAEGFRGCAAYDCFGAGQQVSQVTFGGHQDRRLYSVFPVMRQLHELLWYLTAALDLPAAGPLRDELHSAAEATGAMTRLAAEELLALDLDRHRDEVNRVLLRVSALVRAGINAPKPDHRGADLSGARLDGADLRGASLRGARLIGADLSGADLRLADLTGADLRDAGLRGADLSESLFLTQPQVEVARGDAATRLPGTVSRPAQW